MEQTPTNYKALRILFMSLLTGMGAFALIAVFLIYNGSMGHSMTKEIANITFLIVAGIALLLVMGGFLLYKKKIQGIPPADPITSKMEKYKAAALTRWAMIEFPVLAAIICFLISGEIKFIILVAVLLAIFYSTRPVLSRIAAELSESESGLDQ